MMARQHGRGYIREGDYWVIGTEDGRGRDGYTAREAAQRYNDHRHPAHVVSNDPQGVTAWLNETRDVSQITRNSVTYPGGYEQAGNVLAREPGDVVFYGGTPFMFGEGALTGVSGFGGAFQDSGFVADALTISCATPTPVLALSAEGATGQELDTLYSFVLRPEDLRVAAANIVYEMSCAASIYTNLPVSGAPYAIVSLYRTSMQLAEDGTLKMSDADTALVGSFRVEALSGPSASNSAQRYEVLQFSPSAGLYTLKYRVSTALEASADGTYNDFLPGAKVHLRGLNVRAQLRWSNV
jgi:hypothetical protein